MVGTTGGGAWGTSSGWTPPAPNVWGISNANGSGGLGNGMMGGSGDADFGGSAAGGSGAAGTGST
jgi:hypothetical protein